MPLNFMISFLSQCELQGLSELKSLATLTVPKASFRADDKLSSLPPLLPEGHICRASFITNEPNAEHMGRPYRPSFSGGLPSDSNGLWPPASLGISLWSPCQNEFLVMHDQGEGYLKATDELPVSTTLARTVGMWLGQVSTMFSKSTSICPFSEEL